MIDVLYYIIETVKFFVIYRVGFDMKMSKNKLRIALALISTLIMGITMSLFHMTFVFPCIYVLFAILIFTLLFGQFRLKNLIIVLWAIGVINSVDAISYVLIRLVLHIPYQQLGMDKNIYASLMTILILSVLFFLIGYKSKAPLQNLSFWYYLVFLLICVLNAIILAVVEKTLMNVHGEFTGIYVMLVFSSLIEMAFVLVLASSNNWHKRNEKLKEQYLELQKNYYEYLVDKNKNTQKFRHDIRAHMYVIKQYINDMRWDELKSYVDTMCGKLEYGQGNISVKNGIVDAILNYYHDIYDSKDCEFTVDGNMPHNCNIEAYDLCVIFSNIISNAFEAVQYAEHKQINLSIRFDEEMIYIREKNTYSGTIHKNGENIISMKEDHESHGFGIGNIKECVNKYGGHVDIEASNNEFMIDIIIGNLMSSGRD